jgi:hypothetical protein
MRRNKLFTVLGTAAITMSVFVFVASCHKKDSDTTTTTSTTDDTNIASDHSLAEKTFDDAQAIGDAGNAATNGGTIYRTTATTVGGCATVTHSTGTITVDFGPTNCLCADGRYRRGKIVVTYSGVYADSGSTHTITFVDYYQNDNHVVGTKTVTNMGHNTSGQPYFNVTVSGTVTRTSGVVITCAYNRVRTWTAGYTTLTDRSDDVYSITGGGTITRTAASGAAVDATIAITSPLIVAASCEWIEAGTITYTWGSHTRTLNYGTTAVCDDNATLTTAAGTTVSITLP